MTVKQLITALRKVKNKDQDVYFPQRKFIGNITEVEAIQESNYGFFGKSIPCIMLSGETPEEEEDA
jgi:hypothetical protein